MSPTEQDNDEDDDNPTPLARLSHYLAASVSIDYPRQRCPDCHGGGTIYCPDCLNIFMPRDSWPESVTENRLALPFQLDIILDDRRASSTGVQLATTLKAAGQSDGYRIYDLTDDRVPIPDYTSDSNDHDGTYLLFPDVSAVPLSSILNAGKHIKRLIVLDCKWSKFSKTLVLPHNKAVADVPRLKLDHPPTQSFYWRWHNAGDGAVSTIEAIYYAACQVQASSCRPINLQEGYAEGRRQVGTADLPDLFWLFRLQRNIIADRYKQECFSKSRALPFSTEGKQHQRALRQRQGRPQKEDEAVARPHE